MNEFFEAVLLEKFSKYFGHLGQLIWSRPVVKEICLMSKTRAWYQTVKLSSGCWLYENLQISWVEPWGFEAICTIFWVLDHSVSRISCSLSCLVVFQKDKGQLLAFGDCPSFVTRFRNWMKMCVCCASIWICRKQLELNSSFDNCLQL